MNAQTLLSRLDELGAKVHVVGGRLRVEGPAGAFTPDLRDALARSKADILRLLRSTGARHATPTRAAPAPIPPELWGGERFAIDHDAADVYRRFAENGTQPAWDDLIGACALERQRDWCHATLDAVYRGEKTLVLGPHGHVHAFQRASV